MARSLALFVVVLGHLILAVIDRDANGKLRGDNLLALYPHLSWLTLIAPMPVFFAAGGWANVTATPRKSMDRLRTVVGLAAVVVTLWSSVSVAELLVLGHGSILADGARIATQPLWFLAVYVPLAAYGERLAHFAARPVLAVGSCLALLTIIDSARFGFGANENWGWPSFFLAWGIPWLLGAWWRRAAQEPSFNERRFGLLLVISGLAGCVLLVKTAHYYPALIDAVAGKRSNTTPPTLFTAVAAIAQAGVLMMVAPSFDRIATRWRSVIEVMGRASIAVYMWHLSALVLMAGVVALGAFAPTRLSRAWWLTRPLWFGLVIGLTALFAMATSRFRARPHENSWQLVPEIRLRLGVALAVAGSGIIGLFGPRSLPGAAGAVGTLIAAWWAFRKSPRI